MRYKLLKTRKETPMNKITPITAPIHFLRNKIFLCDLLAPNQKTIQTMQDIEKGENLKTTTLEELRRLHP